MVDSTAQLGKQAGSREKMRINPVAKQVYSGNGGDGLGFGVAANEKTPPPKKEKKKWIVKERK